MIYKITKKIMIIGLSFLILFSFRDVKAYTKTGHTDFISIKLPKSYKLINDLNSDEEEKLINSVPWKLFGWENKIFNDTIPMEYEGKIVFARSNKTNQTITIAYSLREVEITKVSVTTKGSVTSKITGKMKKVNLDGTLTFEYEKEQSNSQDYQKDEKTEFKINLNPNTKITILTTGKGVITSGMSKYYLFGITLKKGLWERVDVESTYFELREENL